MKISVLQMNVTVGDYAKNVAEVERLAAEAMKEKCDVLLLPELWDVGFFPRPIEDCTDEDATRARTFMKELAKKHGVNLVGGSVAVRTGETIKNTCFVYDRNGEEIAEYSKTHLFSPAHEGDIFKAGDKLTTFTLDGVKCGVLICYDLRFADAAHLLTKAGIDLLFIPAEWPMVRLDHWRTLNRTRAIDNQIFVACCNAVGFFANGLALAGHSAIIGPWGDRLAETDDEAGIITAEIDIALRAKILKSFDFAADRREDLYKNPF